MAILTLLTFFCSHEKSILPTSRTICANGPFERATLALDLEYSFQSYRYKGSLFVHSLHFEYYFFINTRGYVECAVTGNAKRRINTPSLEYSMHPHFLKQFF